MQIFKNVFKVDLKENKDKRGFFTEIFRIDQLDFKSKILQVSHSFTKKNILKGWHFHKKQTQWNYLLEGKIKVFLIDIRKNSKTYEIMTPVIIDSKKNKTVYFLPN